MDDSVSMSNAFLHCLCFQICVWCVTNVVFVVRMIYITLVDLLCVYIPAGILCGCRCATAVVMGICKCLIGSDHVFQVLSAGCVCTDA